jgi:tRNA A37 threonylcarbamoyladenosine synthetase subunit TsaC/SUA5/YrdC
VSLIAWRVPNETRAESVARISDDEMSPMAAASAGSRTRPSVASVCTVEDRGLAKTPAWVDGGGEHDRANKRAGAKRPNVLHSMLFLSGEDGFNG